MPTQFSDDAKALINQKNFAHLATLMPDGTPQVTPVWIDIDGDTLRINSAEGRLKVTNLRRDPRVGVEVSDAANPYAYVSVRGRVTEMTHEGADQHIDSLAKKYMDVDSYPLRTPDEQRVIITIEPERVSVWGV